MTDQTYDISSKYLSLIQLVKQVGNEILKIYETDFKHKIKDDESPISEADELANELILKHLKLHFPEYGIISEEEPETQEIYKKNKIFVIDPIDGTKGFIAKNGEFSIMIGIIENFKPYFGIIYQPTLKKLYFAQKNMGAHLELSSGKILPLKTSIINNFDNARMLRSRNHFSKNEKYLTNFLNLPEFGHMGSIGIKSGKIASQENDMYINLTHHLGKWDTCAPEIILKEAGGDCFDKFGFELDYKTPNQKMLNGFIATNGKLNKREVLAAVLKTEFLKENKNCYDERTWDKKKDNR